MTNLPYTLDSTSSCSDGGSESGCGICQIGLVGSLPIPGQTGGNNSGGVSPSSYTGCPILWPFDQPLPDPCLATRA